MINIARIEIVAFFNNRVIKKMSNQLIKISK